jgi:hypothetical protein
MERQSVWCGRRVVRGRCRVRGVRRRVSLGWPSEEEHYVECSRYMVAVQVVQLRESVWRILVLPPQEKCSLLYSSQCTGEACE